MTSLDIRTLSFLAMISSLLLAIGLQIVNRIIAKDPSLRMWAWGATINGSAYVLLALRGIVPDLISIVVANTLLIVGTVLLYLGNRRFLGWKHERPWYWLMTGFAAATLAYFTYLTPSLTARIVTLSAALATVLFPSALVFFVPGDSRDRIVRWFVATTYLASALFLLARAVLMPYLAAPEQDFMMAGNPINTIALVFGIALNVVLGIGLPLLVVGRIQRRLSESETRFSTVFRNSPDPIVLIRQVDGVITDVNSAFLAMHGLMREEVIGFTGKQIGTWQDPQDREDVYALLKKSGRVQNFLYRFRQKSGEVGDALVSIETVQLDGEEFAVAVISNISELMSAREALNHLKDQLSLVIKGSSDAPWDWDVEQDKMYYSPQWWQILGYEVDELPNDSGLWRRLEHPEDIAVTEQALADSMRSSKDSFAIESRLRHKGGHYVSVLTRGFITRNESGIPVRITGTNMDLTAQKRSEEVIRKSEERLRRAELASKSGNWELHLDSRIIIASEGAARIYGLDKDMFELATIQGMVLPECRQLLDVALAKLLGDDRVPYDVEFKIRSADTGEIKDIHSIAALDEKQNILFGIVQDITERKRSDQALVESEARFRSIFKGNGSVMLLIDPTSGLIRDANQAAATYYGYSLDQLVGMSIRQINTLPQEEINQEMERAVQEHRNYFNFVHRLANGDIRNAEVYSTPVMVEGNKLLVSIVHDITERTHIAKALNESEQRFRGAFETAAHGMALVSTEGRFIKVNAALCSMIGYDQADLLATDFQTITHPDDLAADLSYLHDLLERRIDSYQMEKRYFHKTGRIVWILLSVSLVRTSDGIPVHFVAQIQDITQSKLDKQRLERLLAEQKAMLDNELIGIVRVQDRTIIWANPAFEKMLGYSSGELAGKPTRQNYPNEESYLDFGAASYPVLAAGNIFRSQIEHVRKDRRTIWVDVSGTILNAETGDTLWGFVDITERKILAERIEKSEERMELALSGADLGMWDFAISSGKFSHNARLVTMLGYRPEEVEVTDKLFVFLLHPDDVAKFSSVFYAHLKGEAPSFGIEYRLRHKGGHWVWILSRGKVVERSLDGRAVRLAGTNQDITQSKEAEAALKERNYFLSTILENEPECVKVIGPDGTLLQMNNAGLSMLEAANVEEVNACGLVNFVVPEHREAFADLGRRVFCGESALLEFQVQGKLGTRRWLDTHAAPLRDAEGRITHLLGVTRDVSERKRYEAIQDETKRQLESQLAEISKLQERLQEQVIRDPLTDLYNRRFLDETLPRELARAKRENYPLALSMIDLDYFKRVNDTYGHAAGDEVLKALAGILTKTARESDIICRWGGEEFLVALPGMSPRQAQQRVEEWRIELSEMPVRYGDLSITLTLSAGIAGYPTHGEDIEELLSRADEALYRSKNEGRNRVSFFETAE